MLIRNTALLSVLVVLGGCSNPRVGGAAQSVAGVQSRSAIARFEARRLSVADATERALEFAGSSAIEGQPREISFLEAKQKFLGTAYTPGDIKDEEKFFAIKLRKTGAGFGERIPRPPVLPGNLEPRPFTWVEVCIRQETGQILGLEAGFDKQ